MSKYLYTSLYWMDILAFSNGGSFKVKSLLGVWWSRYTISTIFLGARFVNPFGVLMLYVRDISHSSETCGSFCRPLNLSEFLDFPDGGLLTALRSVTLLLSSFNFRMFCLFTSAFYWMQADCILKLWNFQYLQGIVFEGNSIGQVKTVHFSNHWGQQMFVGLHHLVQPVVGIAL